MSEQAGFEAVAAVGAAVTSVARRRRWERVGAVPSEREGILPDEQAMVKWQAIYRLFSATTEAAQDEVFAAVTMYFLANGTSMLGDFKRSVRTAAGQVVEAGEVVKAIGRQEGELRRFMRGRFQDSYLFLKYNPAVRDDAILVEKASGVGLSRDDAWMLADWLQGCPFFVGSESVVYEEVRSGVLNRARLRRSRGDVGLPAPPALVEVEGAGGHVSTVPPTPGGALF